MRISVCLFGDDVTIAHTQHQKRFDILKSLSVNTRFVAFYCKSAVLWRFSSSQFVTIGTYTEGHVGIAGVVISVEKVVISFYLNQLICFKFLVVKTVKKPTRQYIVLEYDYSVPEDERFLNLKSQQIIFFESQTMGNQVTQ